jgi:hypothetical protein
MAILGLSEPWKKISMINTLDQKSRDTVPVKSLVGHYSAWF